MFCPQCGKIMGDEDRFCRFCGGRPGPLPMEEEAATIMADRSGREKWETYESPDRLFRLKIPAGWQVFDLLPGGTDFLVRDPERLNQVWAWQWVDYYDPGAPWVQWVMACVGPFPGILSYRGAAEYAGQFAVPEFKKLVGDVDILGMEPLPIEEEGMRLTGVEAVAVQYRRKQDRRGRLLATTRIPRNGVWTAAVGGMEAPESDFERVAPLMEQVLRSLKMNSKVQEAQEHRKLKLLDAARENQAEIIDMMQQSARKAAEAREKAAGEWGQYLRQ